MNGLLQVVRQAVSGNVTATALAAAILSSALLWWQKHREFRRVFGKADYRPAFNPISAPGMVFGLGMHFVWTQRFTLFKNAPKEVITLEPTIWGEPILYTNSIDVVRQIAGGTKGTPWYKPSWTVRGSLYWGNNVFAAEGDDWRRFRKVLQPAFNSNTYAMVWQATTRLFKQMVVADRWPTTSGETISIQRTQKMTERLALYVLLACGFGSPLSWNQSTNTKDGFSLYDGLKFQIENMIIFEFTPQWILALPFKKFKHIQYCVNGMRNWFNSTIVMKKAEITEALSETEGDATAAVFKKDLFTRLGLAGHLEDKLHLEDSEIIGNMWMMFVAGHETTTSTLAATFCFLAAYKDQQAGVLEEVLGAFTEAEDGTKELTFDKYESLIKTRSTFIEALRLFPAGHILIRGNREDTVLRVPAGVDENGQVVEEVMMIPKDTIVIGDMVGVHYNPRTFPEPGKFLPSRWYGVTEESFTTFSVGPRACIGRRFALTEAVCFLAHVLHDYEVLPLLEPGETLEGWKERVLGKAVVKFTLGIANAPLVFKRR